MAQPLNDPARGAVLVPPHPDELGQVGGSFTTLRGAGELTRELAADCRARLAELGGLAGP